MDRQDKDRLLKAIADGEPVGDDAERVSPGLYQLSRVVQAFKLGETGGNTDGDFVFHWRHLSAREEIGEGGFGKVYRAYDSTLKRDVALKLAHRDREGEGPNPADLVEEARRLARVRHPNVLTIHGAEIDDGQAGIWSELIEGDTLKQRINRDGPLGIEHTLAVARPLSEALAAIHEAGLVHGDIKPGNIMLQSDQTPILMDFGSGGEPGTPAFTGSPVAMAPELLSGMPLSPETDIYAFGVVLYYLLTGTYPLKPLSLEELGEQSGRRSIDGRALPRRLRALTLRCLASDPATRPTVAEVSDALASAAHRPAQLKKLLTAGLVVLALAAGAKFLSDSVPTGGELTDRPPNSIAILPLEDLGDGEDGRRFSDGLSEEILHQLTRFPDLNVVARASSFAFRGAELEPQELASRLRVRYLLTGSVRQVDDQLRITTFLTDHRGQSIWSETYDRSMADVFSLQSDVASAVAAQLSATLAADDSPSTYEPKPAAYQEFLLGREYLRARTPGFARAALGHFNAAIAADPEYASPLAGRALTLLLAPVRSGLSDDPRGEAAKDVAAALALNPDEAFVLAAQGLVLSNSGQVEAAVEPLRRALSLDRDIAGAPTWLSNALIDQGKEDESREVLSAALKRNPLDPRLATNVATRHSNTGNFEAAEAMLLRLLDLPNPPQPAYSELFQLYDRYGRFDKLIAAGKSWILAEAENDADPYFFCSFIAYGYARLALFEQAHYWQDLAESMPPVAPGTWMRRVFIYRLQGLPERMEGPLTQMMAEQGFDLDRAPPFFAAVVGAIRIVNEDYESGVEYLEKAIRWPIPKTQDLVMIDLVQILAFAQQQAGNHDRADQLLAEIEQALDKLQQLGLGGNPEMLSVRAMNQVLLGHNEAALALFQDAYAAGFRHYQQMLFDPRVEPLADQPTFTALMAQLGQDIADQRERVLAIEATDNFIELLEPRLKGR
ncbi:MAG: protein kinase [Pseudomonadota bacterium]